MLRECACVCACALLVRAGALLPVCTDVYRHARLALHSGVIDCVRLYRCLRERLPENTESEGLEEMDPEVHTHINPNHL